MLRVCWLLAARQVVGTMYEMPNSWGKNELVTYQMLPEVSTGHMGSGCGHR